MFADGARLETITDDQRKLVANAIDRSLCIGLSERLEVVPASQPANLTVHAVVTRMDATDENAVAASLGAELAKAVFLPGVPAPLCRGPSNRAGHLVHGGAEARGSDGQQGGYDVGPGSEHDDGHGARMEGRRRL